MTSTRSHSPVFLISHPRSGTHLTLDLIRRHFPACRAWRIPGDYLRNVYLELDDLRNSYGFRLSLRKAGRLLRRARRPLVKTHSMPDFSRFELPVRGFVQDLYRRSVPIYIVRDGRDVLCSAHLWRQEHGERARCSLGEFLRQERRGASRVKYWAAHVTAWSHVPGLHILRYEDILADPSGVVAQIAEWTGIEPILREPILPPRVRGHWHRRWIRLAQLNPESTAILGRYRGRSPEKWQESFTQEDREFFHREAGSLLLRFGYVASPMWFECEASVDA